MNNQHLAGYATDGFINHSTRATALPNLQARC
jgi:hypothetical protein